MILWSYLGSSFNKAPLQSCYNINSAASIQGSAPQYAKPVSCRKCSFLPWEWNGFAQTLRIFVSKFLPVAVPLITRYFVPCFSLWVSPYNLPRLWSCSDAQCILNQFLKTSSKICLKKNPKSLNCRHLKKLIYLKFSYSRNLGNGQDTK